LIRYIKLIIKNYLSAILYEIVRVTVVDKKHTEVAEDLSEYKTLHSYIVPYN